jgi:hypothetical protein
MRGWFGVLKGAMGYIKARKEFGVPQNALKDQVNKARSCVQTILVESVQCDSTLQL